MTTLAWGMTIVGFGGLFGLCFRSPESDWLVAKLLFGFAMLALCGVALMIFNTPYEPIPRRAAFFAKSANKSVASAPIAGAPLVSRIDAAHAAAAAIPLRRLPIADSDVVLP